MKNIAVFALGLLLSCLLMIFFQQRYFTWVDSGGLSTLSDVINHWPAEPSADELKNDLTRLRASAINNPTKENIKAYLDVQRAVMDKAQKFAEATLHVVDESKSVQINNSAATQEIAKYVFYVGCLGTGMLLGIAILWVTYLSAIVIIAIGLIYAFFYIGLPLLFLVAAYLVGNYFTCGRMHNKVLNYLRITRESNRLSNNKLKEKLDRFFHPAKYHGDGSAG